MHQAFQSWLSYHGIIVSSGRVGRCDAFRRMHDPWQNLHGFENVPDIWYDLYYEYRVLLQQAWSLTEPINAVCAVGGGHVDEATDQAILDFFDYAQNRAYQMISEAQALK